MASHRRAGLRTKTVRNRRELVEHFDHLAPHYHDEHGPPERLLAERLTVIRRLMAGASRRTLLEIGCGTGKATLSLAIRGLRVVAVEPDPDMARVARANTAGRRVAIRVSRFEEWHPKPASADLIFAAYAVDIGGG